MFRSRSLMVGAFVVLLALLGLAPTASAASGPYLVPDPGMWCQDFAERQMGNAVGVTYNNLGVTGSRATNSVKCKIIITVNVQERGGKTWRGWSGVLPPAYYPVSFRDACMKQYGNEVGVKWVDTSGALITKDTADDWLARIGTGWFCVGQAGKTYDQSSRPGY